MKNQFEALGTLQRFKEKDSAELIDEMARLCGPLPLGAFPPGTRVVMIDSEPHDTHQSGDKGTVRQCLHAPPVGIAYAVRWDDAPEVDVLTVGWKLGPTI